MKIADLITPALIIDKDVLLRNIQAMAKKAHSSGVLLRPHIKTHKCLEIATLQAEHGAKGITVSTLGEATSFIDNGFTDVTIAYPIIPDKFPTIIQLAQKTNLNIITDHPKIITMLEAQCISADAQLNVLLKIDCGYHRCGVDPQNPLALKLARKIHEASHLIFKGILTHAGHAYSAKSPDEIRLIAEAEQAIMLKFAQKLQNQGLTPETVSIGSTPTVMLAKSIKSGITEVRPGNYVFFDNSQIALGSCRISDCALSVLTSVVSVQDSHVVVDAGATVLSKDAGTTHIPSINGYGIVLDPINQHPLANARITKLSQEHGIIDFGETSKNHSFSPGDHLRIIPNHSCLTANLFDQYYVINGNRVITTWPINRSRLRTPLT